MDRRAFLGTLGLLAARCAEAQQSTTPFRIVELNPIPRPLLLHRNGPSGKLSASANTFRAKAYSSRTASLREATLSFVRMRPMPSDATST
jgi:hypothetical protein